MKRLPLRVRSRIEVFGVNQYVTVSAEEASRLKAGWRGPMPVSYQVEGRSSRTWHIGMMPTGGGSYRLYLNGEVRKATELAVGDMVSLRVRFDDRYRGGPQHPMPPWFTAGLARNLPAKRRWDALPPSMQKEILRYFSRLKSEDARVRNTRRALQVLAGGKGRFLGRSWNESAATGQRPSDT